MADKRIGDFATLAEAKDEDLLLVSSENETYNIKVKTLKDAVLGNAQRAEAAATAAQQAAAESAEDAEEAVTKSNEAVRKAEEALASTEAAEQAAESAAASATSAEQSAASARGSATAAQVASEQAVAAARQAVDNVDAVTNEVAQLKTEFESFSIDADDLGLEQDSETGLVYPTYQGVRSENGIPLAATGGGGGGSGTSATYTITLKNLLENRSFSIPENGTAEVRFSYSSVDEDGEDDGAGVGTILVGGVRVATVNIPQGEKTLDVSPYLAVGSNSVKIKVENSDGLTKSLTYTINVIALSVSTTFNLFTVCYNDLTFYYTPVGAGTKTVHFLMDGEEFDTAEVISSGRSQSHVIPMQSHGAHTLEVYAEMTVDGVTVVSNSITLGLLWIDPSNMTPALSAIFGVVEAIQGETLTIPYLAYDPAYETAAVTLSVIDSEGNTYSSRTLNVDRTQQSWSIQEYPAGNTIFRLSLGDVSVEFTVAVTDSGVIIEPVTDSLVFTFNPSGRSNYEDNPAQWSDGTVTAEFSGVGFSGADGWIDDAEGCTALRLLPGGTMTVPFTLFATDKRTNGVTVEVEMATHNVRDYDSIVMSCLSGGRGFLIASQYAQMNSEQSEISMQFKEDERVRVSFVVEPRNLNRLIYVYVDGIMCGVIQYPEDDNFAQSPAAGITVGAESSGIDVYRIYFYDKGLTRNEILSNYIADRATLAERLASHEKNDLLDVSEEIVISKLPATLPYMIISCPELPQYKGHKKTCEITYVNPGDSSKSFTASGVEIDVQGTSSAEYKKKNFKIKLKNGLTYTANDTDAEEYKLRDDSIPVSVFCLKADVASSESANNVELVRLYNDTCPYKTAPQQADARCRVGIDGLPMIVFWQNTSTNTTKFWGKYNFNNDKSNEVVFGLTEGCESWEIKNNTSDRVIFKKSDYSDSTWLSDFEARYPDKNTDYTNLKRLTDWIVSTDRSAVSTAAAKTERLNKFKNEFENYFVKIPTLYYYLFTEVFLMVDNRAKNFFPSTFDGVHWLPLPYDMDTAIGINNEGQLVFDYDLEDTDTVSGANVFNGQESVLWCNVRDAFADELASMYADLRNGDTFKYEEVVRRYTEHQAVWPEAVWNEDAYEKYLEPLLNDGDGSYLTMLQGNKASQREWWLHNGFRYRDSKYQCGDASKEVITLRCYAVGDITVTPYSHIWPRIKYGSYTVTERGKRNVATTLACPLDTMDDTEVYIYSADRLAEIGDLSPLQVGYANFSMAAKLQKLKLGDGASSYKNTHLTELYVGNNDLLSELNIRNCVNLKQAVDLSDCSGLETIYAAGSAVTALTLPVGGKIKTMELPATITNLTIRDQKQLSNLTLAGYTNISTLRIENTPNVPLESIIRGSTALSRVRLVGVEWNATSADNLTFCINKLMKCGGMDAAGNNTDKAVISGRVYVKSISAETLENIYTNFPDLVVVVNGVVNYMVRYLNYDGTLLYRLTVAEGGDAIDPVALGYIEAPTREGSEDVGYLYSSFGTLPTNIHSNYTLVAQYVTAWAVRFYNGDILLNTQYVQDGLAAVDPVQAGYISAPTKASTAQYDYKYNGWDQTFNRITMARRINAVFSSTVRTYTVTFYNGSTVLQTVNNVAYGSSATYTGSTPVKTGVNNPDDYSFVGWSPAPTNITGDTKCYAQFSSPLEIAEITDSWETILAAVADGTYKTKYSVGNYKALNLGSEGTVNMQIAAFDADPLADGSGNAAISWVSKELLATNKRMNPSVETNYTYPEVPSWTASSNTWTSQNRYNVSDAKAKWTLTATSAGTLTITYKTSNSNASRNKLSLTVNGTAVATDYAATSEVSYTLEVATGDTITVEATYSQLSASYNYYGTIVFSSTGTFTTAAEVQDAPNRVFESYKENTGAIGGWECTEMRSYYKNTLKPLIPELVRNSIKEVSKSNNIITTDNKTERTTSVEDVWMPSYREIFGGTSYEQSGPMYTTLFSDAASRIKKRPTASSGEWWWLRSAYNNYNFCIVDSNGINYYTSAGNSYGVALGFCT